MFAVLPRDPMLRCNDLCSAQHQVCMWNDTCDSQAWSLSEHWCGACVQDPDVARQMGEAARTHVQQNFARQVFGHKLVGILTEMTSCAS